MGFQRQEYWSGLPFPPPGDLPNPRTEPVSPALAGEFLLILSKLPERKGSLSRYIPRKWHSWDILEGEGKPKQDMSTINQCLKGGSIPKGRY